MLNPPRSWRSGRSPCALSIATSNGTGTALIISGSKLAQTLAIVVLLSGGTGTKATTQSSVVGTCTFTMTAQPNATPATRQVTAGQFDVTF